MSAHQEYRRHQAWLAQAVAPRGRGPRSVSPPGSKGLHRAGALDTSHTHSVPGLRGGHCTHLAHGARKLQWLVCVHTAAKRPLGVPAGSQDPPPPPDALPLGEP